MLQKYSKKQLLKMVAFLPLWVVVGFYTAQFVMIGILWLLGSFGFSLEFYNQIVVNSVFSVVLYLLSIAIIMGVPYIVLKEKTTREELGLTRLPSWTDIIITPAGLIIYFVLSSILILFATQVFPWFDVNQVQETGFSEVSQQYELILAFMSLVVLAPIAEELLFRGYLYGRLKKYMPIWLAILATSVTFGFVHGAWNLAVDTFALSVIMCVLRESTGSLWASILLHMAKNGVAFYILFINL